MSESEIANQVLAAFPDAIISINTGTSLRFRTSGLDCACRLFAPDEGWSVAVRDTRKVGFNDADEINETDLESWDLVIPTFKKLVDRILQA